MSNLLQERLLEIGCAVLNYTSNNIQTSEFYNEAMYNKYLSGLDCQMGMGLFDKSEIVEINKLNDETLIIIQQEGVEISKYKYVTIFKATMEYKILNDLGKKVNKTLTFKVRRNEYSTELNYIDSENNSLDFKNINDIKKYLKDNYRNNKLSDWNLLTI